MKTRLSMLAAALLALLWAGSAHAVSMGDFSCTSGSDSRLCDMGEGGLSADLSRTRRGSVILTVSMDGPRGLDLDEVFLHSVSGGEPRLRQLRGTSTVRRYRVYGGELEDLLDRVEVGVSLSYRRSGATLRTGGSPVPEPGAAMLFVLGATTIGFALRRR